MSLSGMKNKCARKPANGAAAFTAGAVGQLACGKRLVALFYTEMAFSELKVAETVCPPQALWDE
jgi:hypothetical protein